MPRRRREDYIQGVRRMLEDFDRNPQLLRAYAAMRSLRMASFGGFAEPRWIRVGDVEVAYSTVMGSGRCVAALWSHTIDTDAGNSDALVEALRRRGFEVHELNTLHNAIDASYTYRGSRRCFGWFSIVDNKIMIDAEPREIPAQVFEEMLTRIVEALREANYLKPNPLPRPEEAFRALQPYLDYLG